MFANTSGGWARDWIARNNYAYGGAGSSYVGATGRPATATAPSRTWWSTMHTAGRRGRGRPACMAALGQCGHQTTAPATALEVVGTTTVTGDLFHGAGPSTVGEAAWTTVRCRPGMQR